EGEAGRARSGRRGGARWIGGGVRLGGRRGAFRAVRSGTRSGAFRPARAAIAPPRVARGADPYRARARPRVASVARPDGLVALRALFTGFWAAAKRRPAASSVAPIA